MLVSLFKKPPRFPSPYNTQSITDRIRLLTQISTPSPYDNTSFLFFRKNNGYMTRSLLNDVGSSHRSRLHPFHKGTIIYKNRLNFQFIDVYLSILLFCVCHCGFQKLFNKACPSVWHKSE